MRFKKTEMVRDSGETVTIGEHSPLYESVVTNHHHFIVASTIVGLWRVTICFASGMSKTRNCSLSIYCLRGIVCAVVQLWYLSLYNASVERLLSLATWDQTTSNSCRLGSAVLTITVRRQRSKLWSQYVWSKIRYCSLTTMPVTENK